MGPKKGKKGKGNKDDDWGDDSEKLMEEKMKKLMSTNDENNSDEDLPDTKAVKAKPNKNKKKGKVKGRNFGTCLQWGFRQINLKYKSDLEILKLYLYLQRL